jgi:hypothetical protein
VLIDVCVTYGIVGKVINGANTSVGIAFADNKTINGAIQGAKNPKQKVYHEHHGRHHVSELNSRSPWSQSNYIEGLSALLILSHLVWMKIEE